VASGSVDGAAGGCRAASNSLEWMIRGLVQLSSAQLFSFNLRQPSLSKLALSILLTVMLLLFFLASSAAIGRFDSRFFGELAAALKVG